MGGLKFFDDRKEKVFVGHVPLDYLVAEVGNARPLQPWIVVGVEIVVTQDGIPLGDEGLGDV